MAKYWWQADAKDIAKEHGYPEWEKIPVELQVQFLKMEESSDKDRERQVVAISDCIRERAAGAFHSRISGVKQFNTNPH